MTHRFQIAQHASHGLSAIAKLLVYVVNVLKQLKYKRIISCEIINSKIYTELSIRASIYLSIYSIWIFLHWLNYSTKVSVERWPHCHVRYCFINSFANGLNNFANSIFHLTFPKFSFFIKRAFDVFYSSDERFYIYRGLCTKLIW